MHVDFGLQVGLVHIIDKAKEFRWDYGLVSRILQGEPELFVLSKPSLVCSKSTSSVWCTTISLATVVRKSELDGRDSTNTWKMIFSGKSFQAVVLGESLVRYNKDMKVLRKAFEAFDWAKGLA